MTMRVTAITRTKSNADSSAAVLSGVPDTRTSMLMGTLSGCSGKFASILIISARSVAFSPMPTMPPQQTEMPASRTWESVSNRS